MALFAYALARPDGRGAGGNGLALIGAGIAIQVGVGLTQMFIKRRMEDSLLAARTAHIVGLVADVLAVVFFVTGTIRALGT